LLPNFAFKPAVLYQIRVKNPFIAGEGEKLAREFKKGVSNPDLVLEALDKLFKSDA